MRATQKLMEEHRLIERAIAALEKAALRLEAGDELRPAFFINAALFIRKYADGCHHHKEEDLLFAAMQEAGMPADGGPLGVMLSEHVQGREFTAAMQAAAEAWEKGDQNAKWVVAHNALGYARLLVYHIQREDKILYPMADKAIQGERLDELEAAFDQAGAEEADAGIHEKYIALVEVLEKESVRKIV